MKQIKLQLSFLITLISITTMTFSMPSQPDTSTVAINYGPWSEILENWVTTQTEHSRTPRVMIIGDKTITVSNKISTGNRNEISETHLYMLGAIEKLLDRIDNMEKRLRRAEEILLYIISGNNQIKEPCPANYTRMGQNCYHFSNRDFNWKSSRSFCHGMGGHLVEFDTIEETQDVIAGIMSNSKLKGKNFWTGGLNPGLLWIWNSGRPVREDTKQSITGNGRCLKLSYNESSKIYSYRGEDCGLRQRYICELATDDESANKIERTARLLIDKNN
ncbi:oxidized low-density lipoprotein receptor 1 [Odontomachus brunneus]|uniref:oxidized low-density lipoprotein receptor 1 n=1 Tax=Odontomachus brunneus TaxID=486640 RepID=UPI0013F19382|nr:oxidized low-density lipoprotein receptor 1 [Odontomachus brunneus]